MASQWEHLQLWDEPVVPCQGPFEDTSRVSGTGPEKVYKGNWRRIKMKATNLRVQGSNHGVRELVSFLGW